MDIQIANTPGLPTYTFPYMDGSTGEEYVTNKEFHRRLGISKQTTESFFASGILSSTLKSGMNLIEWYSNSVALVKNYRKPEFFHPDEIAKRRLHRKMLFIEKSKMKTAKKLVDKGQLPKETLSEMVMLRRGSRLPLPQFTPSVTNVSQASGTMSTPQFTPLAQPVQATSELKVSTDDEFHGDISRREAEAIKQVYMAKQAKLKYLREMGILIKADRVRSEWEEIAVRVRKAMLAIPDRVAHIFATTTDPLIIHKTMTTEISHALSRLQYEVQGDSDVVVDLETQTEVSPAYVEAQEAKSADTDDVDDYGEDADTDTD